MSHGDLPQGPVSTAGALKVALVTGASRGLGAVIARTLASDGWAVAVNYRSDSAGAADVAEGIVAEGGRAAAVRFDVTDAEAVRDGLAADHHDLAAALLLCALPRPAKKPGLLVALLAGKAVPLRRLRRGAHRLHRGAAERGELLVSNQCARTVELDPAGAELVADLVTDQPAGRRIVAGGVRRDGAEFDQFIGFAIHDRFLPRCRGIAARSKLGRRRRIGILYDSYRPNIIARVPSACGSRQQRARRTRLAGDGSA